MMNRLRKVIKNKDLRNGAPLEGISHLSASIKSTLTGGLDDVVISPPDTVAAHAERVDSDEQFYIHSVEFDDDSESAIAKEIKNSKPQRDQLIDENIQLRKRKRKLEHDNTSEDEAGDDTNYEADDYDDEEAELQSLMKLKPGQSVDEFEREGMNDDECYDDAATQETVALLRKEEEASKDDQAKILFFIALIAFVCAKMCAKIYHIIHI